MTGIAEIENAILDRLKAAGEAGVLGYRFRTLESYPENFDLYLKEKIRGDRPYPAAWVVFGGWREPVDMGSELQAEASFGVVVAARNVRNETAQRHGAGDREVGSYQLLQDVAALIHGQHLGLDIGRLRLGQCQSIRPTETILKEKLSVFALEFRTQLPIEVAQMPAREIGDFSTFHADWDLPPLAELTPDPETGLRLPADPDAVEATDHLDLSQEPTP